MNAPSPAVYPDTVAERDRWIVGQRDAHNAVVAQQPYHFLVEQEHFANGQIGDVATIFLTNRECPWKCVMCDLWRNTLPTLVAVGDIPRQIEYALERLPAARQVKLYNSGSFFDTGAIPAADSVEIARLLRSFERVIVECHPSLVSAECDRFQDLLGVDLEVAMGLETAHPQVLERLNKRMTLDTYRAAAERLAEMHVSLRSFVLLQPPFQAAAEAVEWACRSIDFAFECRATAVAVIPVRGGNGAMERLAEAGLFSEPSLYALEAVMERRLGRGRGRIFADAWDLERFACCTACRTQRSDRLRRMNLTQQLEAYVQCSACGVAS